MNRVLKPLSADENFVKSPEKKLLHFGADWITFNIASCTSKAPSSIQFLDNLFNLSHNDTNASEYDGFIWSDGKTEAQLQFTGKNHMGEMLLVNSYRGKAILRIVKVTNMEWAKKFKYKYSYRIDCYGTLFDYERLEILNIQELLSLFLTDIADKKIIHSISRIDICADLSEYSVQGITRGIRGSKAHKKNMTVFNTADPETVNYGKKIDKWMARIYNKKLDVQKKKKEWIYLYLGYFEHDKTTRIEVEAKSDICLEKSLTLPLCFNNEYLFGIYKSLLKNKMVQFQCIRFIELELKKKNFQIITPQKREHQATILSQEKYIKLVVSYINGAEERYKIGLEEIIYLVEQEMGISLNSEKLEKIRNTGKISSSSIT